jgi:predicted Zn-dependent peptidase
MKNILSLFAVTAVLALSQTREVPPAGATPKAFAVPPRETFALKNGMKVSLVPYGSTPMVALSARIAFGNAHEAANEVWLSDLYWSLAKEGAGDRNGIQLAEEAARMGGQLNVGAGVDDSQASIQVLSEFGPDAVKLLADVLERPTLPASELERLRGDLLRRLTVELSQPQPQAEQAFAKALYGDHPYGRTYPTEAMLKSYTIDQVRRFGRANLGARRTHLYVVGRFSPDLKQAITAAFDGWAAGPDTMRNPPQAVGRKQFLLIDRPGAEQSTVKIGLPVAAQPAHTDYIPMLVADNILGGSFGSRITANIREQKGYTYSPFSTVNTRYHSAYWAESADVTTSVTADSVKEIFKEIALMRQEPPTEAELKGIQNYMTGTFVLRNSSHFGIIRQLAFIDSQGLGDGYLSSYVQKVNAVRRPDVQRVAESYLDPAKMTIVVVGDKAKIEDSLKPYR